jgi:hypothetical protein
MEKEVTENDFLDELKRANEIASFNRVATLAQVAWNIVASNYHPPSGYKLPEKMVNSAEIYLVNLFSMAINEMGEKW